MESNSTVQAISKSFKSLTENNNFSNILEFLMQFLIVILLFFVIYFLVNVCNRYIDDKKRIDIGKKNIIYFILVFIFLIFIIILFRSGTLMYDILSPFLFAIILAYVLNPFVTYIQKKGVERIWAVFIIYFIVAGVIFIFSMTLLPVIITEIKNLLEVLPKLANDGYNSMYDKYIKYNKNIENLPFDFNEIKEYLKLDADKSENIIFKVLNSATNTMVSMFSKIVGIILTPILTFYFLKDTAKFKNMLILSIPKHIRKNIIEVAKDIDKVLGGFIRGQLTVAVIVGILTTIVMLLLKVKFAVLIGITSGILNIIPYFGPVAGAIPAIIFASLDGLNKVIWTVIGFVGIQQIESGIISPKIISDKVGVHPTVVILSLIIAGKFFGIFGLLIAVPTAAVIKVLGKHLINYVAKF